jgi:arylsulfatase A-like enzyme
MLEYMDDVLGRLFDYVDSSPVKEDTYVMVMSDNGSEMFLGELPKNRVSAAAATLARCADAAATAGTWQAQHCNGTTCGPNARQVSN